MALPEILRQCGRTGIEQAEIVERAIVLVILRHDADDRGLDAQVDVLGHEHHRHARLLLAQREDRAEDVVVRDHRAEALAGIERCGLETQLADALLAAQLQALRTRQGDAGGDLLRALRLDQLVEEAADLARVAAGFGRALLAVVEFLDDLHRQEHVVLLELEQRGRVVHQHVGVEHVDALAFGHHGFPEGDASKWTVVLCAASCARRTLQAESDMTCAMHA